MLPCAHGSCPALCGHTYMRRAYSQPESGLMFILRLVLGRASYWHTSYRADVICGSECMWNRSIFSDTPMSVHAAKAHLTMTTPD